MKKNYLLFCVGFILVSCSAIFAGGVEGAPGGMVYPVSVDMLSVSPGVETSILKQTHEPGKAPNQDLIDRLKHETLPFNPNDKSVTPVVPAEETDAPIYVWNSWYGPNQNGWVPADVSIAEGPSHILIATNEQFHIYNRSNFSLASNSTFVSFFAPVGAVSSIFDPKVIYDGWEGHWVMLALGRNAAGTESYYYLAVSQTNSATGAWWLYRLNAHVNGSTSTAFWADYPGLGYGYPNGGSGNVGSILITSNQYNSGGAFQYGKIRCLRASQLYVGGGLNWWDFWNFTDVGGATSFTPKPAMQTYTTGNGGAMYVLNTKNGGGNVVNIRRIDNPASAGPTMTAAATTNVTAYTPPPDAPSLGGTGVVDAFDCRTQDVYYMNGWIYTSWVSTFNWGSGNNAIVHYVRINVGTNALVNESRFGSNGIWFMHPATCPEYKSPFSNGYAGIGFSRSSTTIYPCYSVIGYEPTGGLSSYYTVGGTGYLGGGVQRFGDYSGLTYDNSQNGVFWASGMLAKAGSWGTGVFKYAFTTAPVGIQNNNGEIPNDYVLNQNYPNPFNPATKISFGLPKSGNVRLVVYDMLGQEVITLLDEYKDAGTYNIDFNASSLSSGAYVYRLTSNDFTETRKMILSK